MEAYLDNSATTRCYESVRDVVVKTMMTDYGNPSAMHAKGVEAEQYVKNAAQRAARAMKVQEKEIYFTSGGTESDNWALIGAAMANQRQGKHIITTAVEHPAVSAPLAYLAEQGFQVTVLPVNRMGIISLKDLEDALREDTILVSTMFVNNEIGSLQPVEEIGKLLKDKAPGAVYHVDAIQAFGKYRIFPKKLGVDLLAVSGHKIHGPKGTGILYINEKCRIRPLILGGGQQKNMRSGTDNVPGIAGLGAAVEEIYRDFDRKIAKLYELKAYFRGQLEGIPDVVIHGMDTQQGAPHIVNASFLGVRSEVLLHTLEEKGIYVSAGSACSAHKRTGSPTLSAMGASKAEMESAVRFSFSEFTTQEELEYCLEALREAVPMLRRYARY
ncbi:cysteine desulfurase [Lactonifactor longoviformis]|uniref:Cysteine desulfurase n=1 Tax=Lactonifactor longoviformis DSM 17459 TaxID=1122155 RepID=A0A1M4U7Q1_9CLOT|nr:cysteine desulfurase family protein [Lactonifactor longoviformis]POP33773.1 cysteine desulfurase [Lactonifactor longoviformis]SHE52617.1 cysteine desulfurase [Lactonifactor longoviformis DSM 17459]